MDQTFSNREGSMGRSNHTGNPQALLSGSVTSLVRWALDLQAPPALEHQCCDRLRPAWIRRDLDQAVQKLGGALISWQWSGLRQCADGYLLIANQICSFRWIPANGSPLQIHSQLNLNLHTGLTVAPGC